MKPTENGAAPDVEKKNLELAIQAALAMHDQRAEDVVVLDMRTLVEYADFFVIGSASSLTRMRGVARVVERILVKNGGKLLNRPDRDSGWLLADFGDVLVHIFDNQAREYYRLEDLWGDAPRIEWRDRLGECPGKTKEGADRTPARTPLV